MRRLMSVLVILAATACGGGDGGAGDDTQLPDASANLDGAPSSDAPTGPRLDVAWVAAPPLPGQVTAAIFVQAATFHVDRLEVIGDTGDPADTTARDVSVSWSATVHPFRISFFNAPSPAIYSKIRIGIDKGSSNSPSIDIGGSVQIGSGTEPFHIISTKKTDLEITGYNVSLTVGSSATITVDVGLDTALAGIDWMSLPIKNGARTLDDEAAAMDDFIDTLDDTFTRGQ